MRQAGVLAAAGLWAIEHHVDRLVEDHDNARFLSERLATLPGVNAQPAETNIVVAEIAIDADTLVARAREKGVLLNSIGPKRVRLVTHLDVDRAGCERAVEVLGRAVA